jgi:NDP-sugar pyrophosphorylase family protein
MNAFILAGGLGTRLRPLVPDRPKPMAEAGGQPFLVCLVEQLRAQGFGQIVLCVGHRAGQIEHYFGDGQRWGVEIRYSVEVEPLGTAGAIHHARRYVAGAFLVLNGDSYLELDLQAMAGHHRRQRGGEPRTIGTLAAVAVADAGAYGALELDGQGCIRGFREKAGGGPGWINGGVYLLEPDILDLIPAGRAVSLEKETFPLILERGGCLRSYPVHGFFVDIGTPEGYRRFQSYVEERVL